MASTNTKTGERVAEKNTNTDANAVEIVAENSNANPEANTNTDAKAVEIVAENTNANSETNTNTNNVEIVAENTNPNTETNSNTDEIVVEIPTYIKVYKNGTVERPRQFPLVPPSLDDPQTGVSSKDIVISHNPSISARIFLRNSTKSNPNQKVPILIYFHGGGFFFESAFSQLYHHYFNVFVSQIDVLVVSVEYRRAPEHPLPAAYDDCWAALEWVVSHSTNSPTHSEPWLMNHGDFNRVFIGGDSAGGNIVHNVAIRAGAEALPGGVKIVGAIYAHPFFHGSQPIGSEAETRDERSLHFKVWNIVYPSAPGGMDHPVMNPLAPGAPSLAGLGCSKVLVCVAGKDNLRDRGVWYSEAVKKSGWQGELDLFEEKEGNHVYHIFHPESENGKKITKRMVSFILD